LIIYEVRDTFGKTHPYVLPVKPGDASSAGILQAQDKLFYASPLLKWRCATISISSPPDEYFRLCILVTSRESPYFAATFAGRRRALTTRALLGSFFSLPPRHLQDRGRDPLGSAAALAQGRDVGAPPKYRSRERSH
jgi:DUF1365 family protein